MQGNYLHHLHKNQKKKKKKKKVQSSLLNGMI